MEQWRKIEGYENYSVSTKGRVRTDATGLIRCGGASIHGYLRIRLYNAAGGKVFSVHQLVAKAFIPNPNNYKCVNHKDECRTNNNVKNLEWCDHKYNNNYGNRNGKISEFQKINMLGNCIGGKRVIVDDVEYESMLYASQHTKVSYGALRNRKTEYKGHKIKYIANDN